MDLEARVHNHILGFNFQSIGSHLVSIQISSGPSFNYYVQFAVWDSEW